MSLKAFHFVFMIASILLSLFVGRWCFDEYQASEQAIYLISGIASVVTGALLVGYLLWFLKKTKKLSFLLFLGALSHPRVSHACAVCLGNPNSMLTRSANEGVWFLLAVVGVLLSGFAAVFVYWAYRIRSLSR